MLKSFHHTGFVVQDLDTSVGFYTDVMGLEVMTRLEIDGEFAERVVGFKDAHLKVALVNIGDGHNLELVQYISPASGAGNFDINALGAAHLAFFVDDLDRFYAETSQRGLKYNNPPASQYDDQGNVLTKACYAQDPDGNWLEFVETF